MGSQASSNTSPSAVRPTSPRIRVYHAASGSILQGEALSTVGESPARSFQLLPDGLLEAVIVHEGVWQVTELPTSDA